MLDKNQLKAQGLRYARSMQMVFKTISVFSSEHQAAVAPLLQSYQILNSLVKETKHFTIGFVENRVMLNNILTNEPKLNQLEQEFLKRGIGAVTMEVGITMAAYKRAMSVMTVNPKVLEQIGGLLPYLEQNPLEWTRIYPAGKNQTRNESGDTILETDSESFLMQKALSDIQPASAMSNLEAMFQTAAVGVVGLSPEVGSGTAGVAAPESIGGPKDILQLVESRLDTIYANQDDPQRSYMDLAKVLRNVQPDFVLSAFSPERQQQMQGATQERMTTELIEDTAVKWAAERLTQAPTGADALIVEEQVVRVLLRNLEATQTAERLAFKLAEHVRQYSIPKSTIDRIQAELRWVTLTTKQKHAQLLTVDHYSANEFKRLLELLKEHIKLSNFVDASALGKHYLVIFEGERQKFEIEELSRLPELLRAMSAVRTDFWPQAANRLLEMFERDVSSKFIHLQIVNANVALSRSVGIYEDFDLVEKIGYAIEKVATREPDAHRDCCGQATSALIAASSAERVLEIFLANKENPKWQKSAAVLLRWSGREGIEKIFHALDDEKVTANRLALLRVISRIGAPALETARLRLRDSRWYVARNACKLLGDLKDPELLQSLGPVLGHPNDKVQMAAFTVIVESRNPGRAPVLAMALPYMHGQLIDEALTELSYLKDPASLPALETYILRNSQEESQALGKAVQILGNIPEERSTRLLANILSDSTLSVNVRRQALSTLSRSENPLALSLIAEFVRHNDNESDALLSEAERYLKPGETGLVF